MGGSDQDSGQGFQVSDRRFWVQDESLLDQAPPPAPKYPSYVEELKARTEAAEQKLQEKVRRLDQDNVAFRDRLSRRLEQQLQEEFANLLASLLEVVDNLERALQSCAAGSDPDSLRDGVTLTLNLLIQRLQAAGLSSPELLGETFDPNSAEAVGTVAVSDPDQDGRVLEVVQKAYYFRGSLLRPGRVRVGRREGS